MADNVVDLPVITKLKLDPQRVLARAAEAGLTDVVILGYDKDGKEYFVSSMPDGGDVLWLVARMSRKLLSVGDAE
jgi:hypothetical protein